MSSPTFNVTHTNKAASASRVLVADRTDLEMSAQRSAAHWVSRVNLQVAHEADYNATWASLVAHRTFLSMMLNEAQQYHRRTFNAALSTRVLLLENFVVLSRMMLEEDFDNYEECLKLLACHCPYNNCPPSPIGEVGTTVTVPPQ